MHSWNRDQLVEFDVNPATRIDTSRTGRLDYTDIYGLAGQMGLTPFVNPVVTRQNIGQSEFDGANFSVEKRFSNFWAARVSYALGYARGDSEPTQLFVNTYQVSANTKLDLNQGPLNNDRRQNFVLSGRVEIPRTGGLTVSGIYRWMSGIPFTLINSNVDADRNGRLFDELPAGHYCGVGANAYLHRLQRRSQRCARPELPEDRPADVVPPASERGHDGGFDLRVVQRLQQLELRAARGAGANTQGNWYSDQRLTDFLTLTQFTGGQGQPRAAQFSARLGF